MNVKLAVCRWLKVYTCREVDSLMKLEAERRYELMVRLDDVEHAYANDPRRLEIEKEKQKTENKVSPGFVPFTRRKARWQSEHAKPRKTD